MLGQGHAPEDDHPGGLARVLDHAARLDQIVVDPIEVLRCDDGVGGRTSKRDGSDGVPH